MSGIGDKKIDTNGSIFLKLVKFMMTDKFTGSTGITSRLSHPLKTEGLNFLFELQDFNQSFRFYLFNLIVFKQLYIPVTHQELFFHLF